MNPDQIAGVASLLLTVKDVGAFGVLGMGCWLLLTSRIVTRGHLNDVVAGKNAEIAKAEAREAEWRRLAVRGADEIIQPLAQGARAHVTEQLRVLRGPSEPS